MLERLRELVSELAGGDAKPAYEDNDYRLAAAALLTHVIYIDGVESPAEHAKLHALLKQRFSLDDAATKKLIEAAIAAEHESVDLYKFTSLLNRALDEDARRRIVEMMWELVYADGAVSEFEDNVIWRAADLLHVPSRDRVELRRRVAQHAREDGDE